MKKPLSWKQKKAFRRSVGYGLYGVGAQILRELGVHKMRLLTNNPVKRVGLEAYGLEIVENVPVETVPNPYNERYLRTKKERMGHTLHFNK